MPRLLGDEAAAFVDRGIAAARRQDKRNGAALIRCSIRGKIFSAAKNSRAVPGKRFILAPLSFAPCYPAHPLTEK